MTQECNETIKYGNYNNEIEFKIKNGKGNIKENKYEKEKLEFEGEYLYGKKWDGKIKEYNYNGKLNFEGIYINGERNGKGKEYNYDGNLEYEGEFLNGLKNGKGKEYYYNSKLKFKGEYFDGMKWKGKGYNFYGKLEYELEEGNGNIKEYYDYNGTLKF